MKTVQRISWF